MSSIVLGQIADTGRKASLDLDVMLRTRLLIQANSGGGKSYLLRRLAEQLFGKIPVILVDPEGEFSTLRERYGYVLVGKGGETPADTRSAALVAHKLLELRASAVCDLYEMPALERHRWVRLFLEALIDAPKRLWRPTVVIVDESHVYCPEKGQGESEAHAAMAGLVTRGRKRGFGAVFATQRLAKLSKNVSAEMLNRLVGQTFEDLDLDRAADLLSVPRGDRLEFFRQMKVIEPGHFWAFGRALAKNRLLVKVGPVMTTHPEPGTAGYAATPPPAPDKVKALLPKLADLPKQAEEKARTEAEFRTEIRSLKAQLAARPKEMVETSVEKRVEVPVLKEPQMKRLDAVVGRLQKIQSDYLARLEKMMQPIHEVESAIASAVMSFRNGTVSAFQSLKLSPPKTPRPPERTVLPAAPARGERPTDGALPQAKQKILDALAWLNSVWIPSAQKVQLALLAGQSPKSSAYTNNLGALRTAGMISYPGPGMVALTEQGRHSSNAPESPPTTEALQKQIFSMLPPAKVKILRVLVALYPRAISKDGNDGLAERAEQSSTSSAFTNNLGSLRSLGLISYPSKGHVAATPVWFLEDR